MATWELVVAIVCYVLMLITYSITKRRWLREEREAEEAGRKYLQAAERVCRAVVREKKAAQALSDALDPYGDEYHRASDEWAEADKALEEALREWEATG